jgi:PAS domain S-box-containing protein
LVRQSGDVEYIGAVVDITEHKRAEQELRDSEQKHRVVVETAGDAVISMDENSTILLANAATLRIFGYDPVELIGKPLTVLMPEFLRKAHEAGFKNYLATGKRHINWQGTELTGLRKNGQEFPVEISFGELTKDGHRILTGFIRDISERKRAEEALRRSEAYLAEGQKLSHTGSWHCNVGTGRVEASKECRSIFGVDSEKNEGSYSLFLERVHPEDRSNVEQIVWAAAKDKTDWELECRVVAAGGAIKSVYSIGHCKVNRSGEIEYIGISMDITEGKRAEEERERLRQAQAELAHINRVSTMGELAGSLAHEIKQPISAAMTDARACSRWLTRDLPDLAKAQAAASRVVNDVARASEIIGRVRSLFKKDSLQHEEVDINEVIREMIALLRGEASGHSISIHSDIAPDLPTITADRVQIQQVFMNLMLNGIEAMKSMNTPGKLTVRSQRDGSGQLLISVMDTGVGVPAEKMDQIFNPFFTSKPEGTGMGLPISRSIIESHGGRLWAVPNPESGSIFRFTLPTERTAHQAA